MLVCSLIVVASLIIWSGYLDCVEMVLVLVFMAKLMLCRATADLSGCVRWVCCWVVLDPVLCEMASLPIVDLPHSQGMLYRPVMLSKKSFFMGCRKLGIFLGGGTDLMCLDSILLMQLKVVLTKNER